MGEVVFDESRIDLAKCNINMLRDLGFELKQGMKILDFGCGEGQLAHAFTLLGYDTYGADFVECPLLDKNHFSEIEMEPYKLPFDDNFFDLVISTSVFEHTLNTEECFREVYRVLKPGGVTINSLPSMYRLRESHIRVPLAGVIQASWWLKMWAFLGIRNRFQTGKDWREVYRRNTDYCANWINYHKYKDLKAMIISVFGNVKKVKKEYIANMPGGAAKLGRKLPIPGYGELLFFFREWELFMRKEAE